MKTKDWLLLIFLCCLLFVDEAAAADDDKYGLVCGKIVSLLAGPFGAMLTAAAGVGAIIASALGGFKMAWSLLVVAASCFILKGYVNVFYQNLCQ